MTKVRNIVPKTKRDLGVARTLPFTHGMEEFFENFPRRWLETRDPHAWKLPFATDLDRSFRLDVLDKEEFLFVRAELPGVDKDEIEVTVAGDYLTIEAGREFKEEEEKDAFYRHEVGYGKLTRTIALPVDVDPEHVIAEMKNGMLEIKLPKAEVAKRHTVKVA